MGLGVVMVTASGCAAGVVDDAFVVRQEAQTDTTRMELDLLAWYPLDRGQQWDPDDPSRAERAINRWNGNSGGFPYFGQSTLRFPGVPFGLPAIGEDGPLAGRYYFEWPCQSADACGVESYLRHLEIVSLGAYSGDTSELEIWAEGQLATEGGAGFRVYYEMPAGGCNRDALHGLEDAWLTSSQHHAPLIMQVSASMIAVRRGPEVCGITFRSYEQAFFVNGGDNVDWEQTGAYQIEVAQVDAGQGPDVVGIDLSYLRDGAVFGSEERYLRRVDPASPLTNGLVSITCSAGPDGNCAEGLPVADDDPRFSLEWCEMQGQTPHCS